jgi:hypothetical protein
MRFRKVCESSPPRLTALAGPVQDVGWLLDPQGQPIPVAAPEKRARAPDVATARRRSSSNARARYYFRLLQRLGPGGGGGGGESTHLVYRHRHLAHRPVHLPGRGDEARALRHAPRLRRRLPRHVVRRYHTSELSGGNTFRRAVCITSSHLRLRRPHRPRRRQPRPGPPQSLRSSVS